MSRKRVISFIDGFNLYHAIDGLNNPSFKWLDLRKLTQEFIHPEREELAHVLYFSTIASHRNQAAQIRQRTYLRALELRGVKIILGQFKQKDRECSKCFARYTGFEEKETDVNIALTLMDLAYQDAYDRAILVTNDSDQVPTIRKVLERFPCKSVTILIPPFTRECNELIRTASAKAKITTMHLQKCQLSEVVSDASGQVVVKRPKEYANTYPIPIISKIS
ncbi:MAG: NYN domain-containing protein [Parachlamydiales bacterium]|nr:NYN domain-containing protein [Parachlamydiales bacterium]